MGCQALMMRKSTRAHWVDPPNALTTFQSPALGGQVTSNSEMGTTFDGTMPNEAVASLVMIPGRHP